MRTRATLFPSGRPQRHKSQSQSLKKKSRVVKINIKHSRSRPCAVNSWARTSRVQFCSALKNQFQLRFFQLPTSLSRLSKTPDITPAKRPTQTHRAAERESALDDANHLAVDPAGCWSVCRRSPDQYERPGSSDIDDYEPAGSSEEALE